MAGKQYWSAQTDKNPMVSVFELDDLLDSPLPPNDPENVGDRVEKAVALFRNRKSTADDKQHAVRDLADVLEYLRPQAKATLNTKDENDLFEMINRFGIRHHNDRQKIDYDPKFLDWIFYHSLAAIHTILALLDERS